MPVAVRITPHHMSKQEYERLIAELEASGLREQDRPLFHAAYGEDGVRMFEVWQSPEQFEAQRERMLAILQGITLGPALVEIDKLQSHRPN
jgi:quinol monooxygenase YgiN